MTSLLSWGPRMGAAAIFLLATLPAVARGGGPFFVEPAGPGDRMAVRPIRTRHPVVFAHGIMGFRALVVGGVNFGNYFRGVEHHLRALGVEVHADDVGMTNGVPQRARRLADQISRMLPHGKVNIIAHSLGALDSRYAISLLGMAGRVATLTTVGGTHRGTYVADWATRRIGHDLRVQRLLDWAGVPSDAFGHLTTDWVGRLNQEARDAPSVRYFSLGGTQPWYEITPPLVPFHFLLRFREQVGAGLEPSGEELAALGRVPFGDLVLDTIKEEMAAVRAAGPRPGERAVYRRFKGANDGLVPLSSTVWGEAHTVLGYDHLDQIGWLTTLDAPALYEGIVRRLAELGY